MIPFNYWERPLLLGCAVELRTARSRHRVGVGGTLNLVPRSENGVRGLQLTGDVDHHSSPDAIDEHTAR